MTGKTQLKGFSPVRKFKNDENAVNNGVWCDIEGGVARLLLSRWNNEAHQAYARAEKEKHAKVLEKEGSLEASKVWEGITNRSLALHILKGWEGILDEDGNELPFTPENALKLVEELPEFGSMIFELSTDVERYRLYKVEDAVKN